MSSSKFGFVLILALLWVFQGMSPEVRAQNPSDTSAYPAYSTHSILDDPRLSRRLSLDLRDTNIADAIRFLADGAGVNIAVSKNVGGRVTLSLSDVTVRDALDIILVSNDLALERRGDIYYVLLDTDHEATTGESWSQAKIVQVVKLEYAAASDILTVLETLKSESGSVVVDPDSGTVVILDTPEKLGPMMDAISAMEKERDTRVIRLQYADAEKVEEALTERLDSKGVGSIKASEDNNQLIVTTLPGRMDEILQIISELDVPDKQVLIEAKIVKVTLTPDYRMGIDWEKVWRNGKKHAITLGMNFPIPDPPAVSSFGNLTAGTLATDHYEIAFKMLETIGNTKLLSSPRITVLHGEEANILVGTREAFITQTVTQSGETVTTAENVTFLDVGVQLFVSPEINDDGFVTMRIRPEVSAVGNTVTTAQGNIIPIVDTATAETSVRVKNGYTIIIGGLIKDETVSTTKQIPVLGNIPILGAAFKEVNREKEKTELVVFLTPKIVTGEENMESWEEKPPRGLRPYDPLALAQ